MISPDRFMVSLKGRHIEKIKSGMDLIGLLFQKSSLMPPKAEKPGVP